VDVVILPAVVQGDGAAATIAQRIEEANLRTCAMS
jgi:exonuclease VII large subunit